MLGDMDFFSDPGSSLANAVVKTNDQLHQSVRRLCHRRIPVSLPGFAEQLAG